MPQTLVLEMGGTKIKVLASGRRHPVKIPSGKHVTPQRMVEAVQKATASWEYDRASIARVTELTERILEQDVRNVRDVF